MIIPPPDILAEIARDPTLGAILQRWPGAVIVGLRVPAPPAPRPVTAAASTPPAKP